MTDRNCHNNHMPRLLWIALKAGFLLGLLVLNACGSQENIRTDFTPPPTAESISPSSTEISPVSSPNLPGYTSPTPVVSGGVEPTGTPAPLPTSQATPDLPAQLPGWIWYQSSDLAYLIAYPQSWTLQKNPGETGAAVRERVSFRSPETGSEVIIDVWDITTPDFDLLDWINSNPERVLYDRLEAPVNYNATILGQQAVFHFHPAGWGTRDMAALLFTVAEYRFRILFNSATTPITEAEPYVYLYMLESFSLPEYTANGISVPTGWEKGAGLITIIDPPQPTLADLPLDEQQPYQYGLMGTVEDWNETPGAIDFTLITDEGNRFSVYGDPFRVHFRGLPIDYKYNVNILGPRNGGQVWVAGQLLATGEMLAEYVAVEANGEWQTWFHKSLFNVTNNEFNSVFLTNYDGGETFNVWLQGPLEITLPLLVDQAGHPVKPGDWLPYLKREVLAYGVLRADQEIRVELQNLYLQDGECTFSNRRKFCHSWQQLYPPISTKKSVTAIILNGIPEARTIVLQQPVEGIVAITLTPDGKLLTEDGEIIGWENLAAGAAVQAIGEIGTAGTFIAEEIHLQ